MITEDQRVKGTAFIKRTFINNQGEIFATATLAPSVLPMMGFSLDQREQAVWLLAVRNKGEIKKGNLYRLSHIHTNGQVVVSAPEEDPEKVYQNTYFAKDTSQDVNTVQIRGLWPMDLFAEYVLSDVKFPAPKAPKAAKE